MNTVKHPNSVSYVRLQQPSSTSNGDVFVSICNDGVLHLFDTHRSVTAGLIRLNDYKYLLRITFSLFLFSVHVFIPALVFESTKEDRDKIWTATFSPVDSRIIASACPTGEKLFDIR